MFNQNCNTIVEETLSKIILPVNTHYITLLSHKVSIRFENFFTFRHDLLENGCYKNDILELNGLATHKLEIFINIPQLKFHLD